MEEKESQDPAERGRQPEPSQSQSQSPPAQQVTSTDQNKTKPKKDPGRVAAGKKLAEHNRRVREQKKVDASKQPNLEPEPEPKPEPSSSSSSFSLTQILSVASIVLSLAGLYYKRKELMELVKSRPNPEPRQIQRISAGESAELPQIPKRVKPMD